MGCNGGARKSADFRSAHVKAAIPRRSDCESPLTHLRIARLLTERAAYEGREGRSTKVYPALGLPDSLKDAVVQGRTFRLRWRPIACAGA
jgi:hypothetical protein